MEKGQHQLTTEVTQLTKQKPYLATISEGKKVRDFTPEEQERYNGQLITYLLAMLGISGSNDDGRQSHYLAVDQFISTELNHFTYKEIREAFSMLIKGEFQGMPELGNYQVFNKLDCVIVAKAMNCYSVVKRERLRNWNPPKPELPKISESEQLKIVQSGVMRCYREFQESGEIPTLMFYVYDVLNENDILNPTDDEKKVAFRLAKEKLTKEKKRALTSLKIVVGNGEQVAKAKVMLLESFFRTINEQRLKSYISKIKV